MRNKSFTSWTIVGKKKTKYKEVSDNEASEFLSMEAKCQWNNNKALVKIVLHKIATTKRMNSNNIEDTSKAKRNR
jgi:hypothetical protein